VAHLTLKTTKETCLKAAVKCKSLVRSHEIRARAGKWTGNMKGAVCGGRIQVKVHAGLVSRIIK
jgi:hypothetical protein